MARQVTYLSLTSDITIDGCVRTHGAWDTLPTMARLDLLRDWQGELTRIYDAEYKMWAREFRAKRQSPTLDEDERILSHLFDEIARLEEDNAYLREQVDFLKEDKNG